MNGRPWLDALKPWTESVAAETGFTRSTIAAVVILIAGIAAAALFARLARGLAVRGSRFIEGLHPRTKNLPSSIVVERAVGRAVFWLVLVFAAMAATETLGLPVVTAWLSGVATFLPRVAVAILILALGFVAARVCRHLVSGAASSAKIRSAERLGRLTEAIILVGTGLVAIEQLGIEISFLKNTVLIVLTALLAGASLAFGLGARDLFANILAAHYVYKLYQVGQIVRIDGAEGRITRFTETSVILEAADGEIAVPARTFTAQNSTLIAHRSTDA